MTKTYLAAATVAALLGTLAVGPSAAQPNGPYDSYDSQYNNGGPDRFDQRGGRAGRFEERLEQAYRDGYRRGYDDRRANRRFDDRMVSAVPGPGPGPGFGGPGFAGPPGRDLDRDNRWRARYARTYTRDDDSFYQECRQTADPAGIIVGGLIGGLLGNAIGRGNGGATVAGVIVGGVTGAALTRNLDCEDRSYAYKAYYDGFNSGRPNSSYAWRNPRNGHRGDFVVGQYYNDQDGFRCAPYTQRIYITGQPQTATGRACQQPDGSWTIVG